MNNPFHSYLSALPVLWLIDAARYLVAASVMAAILAMFWRVGLAERKLQARHATARDIRREVLLSLRTTLVFALLTTAVLVAARHGWLTIYWSFKRVGPLYLVLSLPVMLMAHDTYFYWTHRAMHHPRLFKLFHRTHHLSRTPTPWTAYSFSVPEAIVQGAFVPLFLVFVPMHEVGLALFLGIQIVRNVMGHAGTEIHPSAFGPGRWLGWNNTTTHHDLHHESSRYNYGLYFRWWDKLMGTEHPDYRRKFESFAAARKPVVEVH
jgi:lathosterol oxidase